ncbi:hypothetical protein SUGI_1041380 [Cryptomeria japonica]|nr:hypothetical protein SUGI_1041380 [Cryptomeria japonica]
MENGKGSGGGRVSCVEGDAEGYDPDGDGDSIWRLGDSTFDAVALPYVLGPRFLANEGLDFPSSGIVLSLFQAVASPLVAIFSILCFTGGGAWHRGSG